MADRFAYLAISASTLSFEYSIRSIISAMSVADGVISSMAVS